VNWFGFSRKEKNSVLIQDAIVEHAHSLRELSSVHTAKNRLKSTYEMNVCTFFTFSIVVIHTYIIVINYTLIVMCVA
jgi:hypothetical protein